MNHSENVDHDAVLRARTMLLGSGRPSWRQEVEAYRVLAEVSPAAYLPKLAATLTSYRNNHWRTARPEVELACHAEAADAARRIDRGEPNRTEVLCWTLDSYRRTLLTAGRRAEAFAVCEEMAEAGRLGFERGQVQSPAHGQCRLATMLAEEGRHGEAADLRGRSVAAVGDLDAAGRHEEALAAFTEHMDRIRSEIESGASSSANLVWELVHRSKMFDTGGRREEAGADRREALRILARLAEGGEPGLRSNDLGRWSTVFALSGRAAEPPGTRDAPMPPFGIDCLHWSPDAKESYVAGIPSLETDVAELAAAGRIAEAVEAHRRLVRRSAVLHERHAHGIEECLRPLFDEGVALARRVPAMPETIVRSLTDRAMFLAAVARYGDAHADFAEAMALLGGATNTPIVTRT
ncbi:hypothetical protein ACFY8C_20670 [Streptomyces flavochromogenes]|uniref:Tetratricopeptide repeat protein n=1 Tax=Streptomyces flavochromogenes TaxID=68199 RepID=A0ABW6XT85_9ACTN|nr:hypothetical protein [Streptomyces flavochromogenes]